MTAGPGGAAVPVTGPQPGQRRSEPRGVAIDHLRTAHNNTVPRRRDHRGVKTSSRRRRAVSGSVWSCRNTCKKELATINLYPITRIVLRNTTDAPDPPIHHASYDVHRWLDDSSREEKAPCPQPVTEMPAAPNRLLWRRLQTVIQLVFGAARGRLRVGPCGRAQRL